MHFPQGDGKAQALLQRMPSDAVRSAVLEQLEGADAQHAAVCRALLAAEEQQEEEEQQQQAAGAAAEEQQEEAATAGRSRGSRRAAATSARHTVKRAASAALSDSDATETEKEEPSEVSRWAWAMLAWMLPVAFAAPYRLRLSLPPARLLPTPRRAHATAHQSTLPHATLLLQRGGDGGGRQQR